MILNMLLVSAAVFALVTRPAAEGTAIPRQANRLAEWSQQDTVYVKQISEGDVTLEFLPRWEDSVLVIKVTANTHSVDLSGVNLQERARLIVDDMEVTPMEAGSMRGHHAATTLVFPLSKRPNRFTLEITGVPDVPVRVITWPGGERTP